MRILPGVYLLKEYSDENWFEYHLRASSLALFLSDSLQRMAAIMVMDSPMETQFHSGKQSILKHVQMLRLLNILQYNKLLCPFIYLVCSTDCKTQTLDTKGFFK